MSTVTAIIYSRISHDPEGRQAGVERQEQDCRQMATERGWVVLEPVYRENDVSASTRSKKRRPVFDRMLDDLAGRSAAVLLAYSTSRPTRRPLEHERLIDLTSRTGLEIHTVVSGPVLLDTADGRALARELAAPARGPHAPPRGYPGPEQSASATGGQASTVTPYRCASAARPSS